MLRLVIAATFVWAAGTDAYGSAPCSHHDALGGFGVEDSHVPAGSADAHEVASPADADPHTDHGDGPCTCITHCQASGGDVSPSHVADGTLHQPDISVGLHPPILRSVVLGPRHHLFELHLPNAPPHSA